MDGLRKRPLIVFDGSSTSTSIKVKKTENGADERLKPPAQTGATRDALQKLPNSSSRVSPLALFSNLPMNNKTEHNNNDTKQNHDLTHRKSPSGPVKSPPLSPVGTTPVKLKRAAPKEETETTVSVSFILTMAPSIYSAAPGQPTVLLVFCWGWGAKNKLISCLKG